MLIHSFTSVLYVGRFLSQHHKSTFPCMSPPPPSFRYLEFLEDFCNGPTPSLFTRKVKSEGEKAALSLYFNIYFSITIDNLWLFLFEVGVGHLPHTSSHTLQPHSDKILFVEKKKHPFAGLNGFVSDVMN